MARNVNDLKLGFQFDSSVVSNITYNLNSSDAKWNGVSTVVSPSVDYFNGTPAPASSPDKLDFDSSWKSAFRDAINLWKNYANLNFSEVTGDTDANLYAYRADVIGQQGGATVWFDKLGEGEVYNGSNIFDGYARSEYVFDNQDIAQYGGVSGYREYITLHEIGHMLGLQGDGGTFASTYTSDMTVMSYNITGAGYNVTTNTFATGMGNPEFAITPMYYDIWAIQDLYGVRTDYNADSTLYKINENEQVIINNNDTLAGGGGRATIWDSGTSTQGTDTFQVDPSYSGDAHIDLRAGFIEQSHIDDNELDSYENNNLDEQFATKVGSTVVYIAREKDGRGSIEAAIGAGGNDEVHGNSADNVLRGEAGNDLIFGYEDDDILEGGTGDDTLVGGAGADNYVFSVGDGKDTIFDTIMGASDDSKLKLDGKVVGTAENIVNGIARAIKEDPTDTDFKLKHDGKEYSLEYDLINGGDLVIKPIISGVVSTTDSITIKDYENGKFGLGLINEDIEVRSGVVDTGTHAFASIASLSASDFVVTWKSLNTSGNLEVLGQRYNFDGTESGSVFEIVESQNTYSNVNSGDFRPSVTTLTGGDYIVSWGDSETTGIPTSVQRYNSDGTANGSAYQIDSYLLMTPLSDGGFFTTRFDDLNPGDINIDIMVQRYNANGTTNGNEVSINTPWSLTPYQSGTLLSNGDFVLIWNSFSSEELSEAYPISVYKTDILGQRFSSSGNKIGGEFTVMDNQWTIGTQDIVSLSNGGFAVVWSQWTEESSLESQFYAQRYSSGGNKVGGKILLNSDESAQPAPIKAVALSDGGFVAVWNNNNDLVGQRVNANGSKNGYEFIIESGINLNQDYDITELANGDFVVTWDEGTGTDNAVKAKIIGDEFLLVDNTPDDDSITGSNTPDNIGGGNGNDTISTGDDDDTLDGGDGNDLLNAGEGDDSIDGGDGTDFVTYEDEDEDITVDVDLEDGITEIMDDTISVGTDTLQGIEGIIGTSGNDNFVGDRHSNYFVSNGGQDTVDGGLGFDAVVMPGALEDYSTSFLSNEFYRNGTWTQSGTSNSVNLTNVERLIFDNGTMIWTGGHWLPSDPSVFYLPIDVLYPLMGAVDPWQPNYGPGSSSDGSGGSASGVNDLVGLAEAPIRIDPLVLDLGGNGVKLLNLATTEIFFDMDNDSLAEKTGWVAAEDALLVTDNNSNGIIDNITELMGDETTDGFTELATFDENGDGIVNSQDSGFTDLLVWQDLDEDGITDSGELDTLANHGITSFTVGFTPTSRFEEGNQIIGEGHFTIGSEQNLVSEVLFLLEPETSIPANGSTLEIDPTTFSQAFSIGYGDLPYLQAAMTSNETLYQMMQALDELSPEDFDTASDKVRDILFEWADASEVDPASRGEKVDGQEITFLEAFTGRSLAGGGNVQNVHAHLYNQAFDLALEIFETRFLAQGAMNDVFPDAVYDFETGDVFIGSDLSTLQTAATNSTAEGESYWIKWATIMHRHEENIDATEAQVKAAIATVIDSKLGLDVSDSDSFIYLTSGEDSVAFNAENNVIFGSDGNDSIVAHEGDDIMSGGAGNDNFQGSGSFSEYETDDDTYLFGLGDGQDTITDNYGNNVIVFGDGISQSDIRMEADGLDLLLYLQQSSVDTGDMIRLHYQLWGAGSATISELQFADTTTFDLTQDLSLSILGTSSGEQLVGGTSADLIVGLGGDDNLNGSDGDDTLHGGTGNDTLIGGNGEDVFLFGRGDGQDIINYGDVDNVIQFGEGIDENDIRLEYQTGTGGNDLFIYLQLNGVDTGDVIQIVKQDVSDGGSIPVDNVSTLKFDDGSEIDLYAGVYLKGDINGGTFSGSQGAETIDAGAGADNVIGWGGNDTILGGAGDDTLNGHNGTDTYIFGYGDGQDTIADTDAGNYLEFEAGITLEDIRMVTTTTSGVSNHNLYVYLQENGVDTGDVIYMSQVDRIAEFRFADSTVLTSSGGLFFRGSDSAETLYGSPQSDTLDGGAGNDSIIAWGGDDTVLAGAGDDQLNLHNGSNRVEYALGDGDDTIADVSNTGNTLAILTTGITEGDLTFTEVGNNLEIGFSDGGSVTVTNFYTSSTPALSEIEFEDSSTYDLIEEILNQPNPFNGSSASESLYGTSEADIFNGMGGDDVLYGYAGDDIYVYNLGDGNDLIAEYGSEHNVIQFGAGITASNISFSKSGQNMLITMSDSAVITSYQHFDGSGQRIAEIIFDDESTIDLSGGGIPITGTSGADNLSGTGNSDTLSGLAGNDVLSGTGGGDIFIGGTGDDTLNGYYGNDTYEYNSGDGDDYIVEYAGDANVISFGAGIDYEDLTFSLQGSKDLMIDIDGGGSIQIWYHFDSSGTRISELHFDDSSVVDIAGKGLVFEGTSSGEVLSGTDAADTLNGYGGNDQLYGNSGDDVLNGGAGLDYIYGYGGNDVFVFDALTDSTDSQRDLIGDFAQGTELIDLSAISSIDEFSDLSFTQSGSFTYVNDDGSDFSIGVYGTFTMTASDFIFV